MLANGKFNFRAVICGAIVSLTLLNNYYFNRVVGSIACIAISIIVPIIIELILLFKYKKKCNDKPNDPKMKTNKEKTEKVKKEEFVWNRIFYILYVKNGLFVLAVCILLAPVVGMISARANPNYQTCKYDSKTYAIIVEYEDSVLVQEADVCDNTITILTNSYRYLPKESLEIKFSTYDVVLIQEGIYQEAFYNERANKFYHIQGLGHVRPAAGRRRVLR